MKNTICPFCGQPLLNGQCPFCDWDGVESTAPVYEDVVLAENGEIAEKARTALAKSKKARAYLADRKISLKEALRFGLGYVPEGCGWFRRGDKVLSVWEDRILIPIYAPDGKAFIGFGARALSSEALPKYINSGVDDGYDKGKSLYGLHLVSKEAGEILLVEGFFDAISASLMGYSAVASLGTSLTQEQARLLRQHTEKIAVGYDCDDAGEKATLRAVRLLWQAGFSPENICILKPVKAKDADEARATGESLVREPLSLYLRRIRDSKPYGEEAGKVFVEGLLYRYRERRNSDGSIPQRAG